MAYAPDVHKLYVSDETGGTETVMDVRSNARTATIPLGGATGNTQYDPLSRHIFVNVQSRGELVEIDPQTEKIVARHALPGAKGNHGLLIEPGLGLAFIGCEGNDKLLVFDLGSKRVTAAFEVGAAPDVLAFDPGLNWLYVASEEGIVTVFSAEGGVVRRAGEGFVGPNAHVVGVDPRTHRTYFPLKDVGGRSILRIMEPK